MPLTCHFNITRTSGRYHALVLVPRFARQNYQKVLFQFLTLHYILLHYLHFFVYINMCLGLEEDLTIDNILGSLNLVVLVFVKGEL